jgi:hypothetical protein
MTTIAEALPTSIPHDSAPLSRSLYRFSIEKYEAMVRSGVFTKRDRIVLIEGILVKTMSPSDTDIARFTELAKRSQL